MSVLVDPVVIFAAENYIYFVGSTTFYIIATESKTGKALGGDGIIFQVNTPVPSVVNTNPAVPTFGGRVSVTFPGKVGGYILSVNPEFIKAIVDVRR